LIQYEASDYIGLVQMICTNNVCEILHKDSLFHLDQQMWH